MLLTSTCTDRQTNRQTNNDDNISSFAEIIMTAVTALITFYPVYQSFSGFSTRRVVKAAFSTVGIDV